MPAALLQPLGGLRRSWLSAFALGTNVFVESRTAMEQLLQPDDSASAAGLPRPTGIASGNIAPGA